MRSTSRRLRARLVAVGVLLAGLVVTLPAASAEAAAYNGACGSGYRVVNSMELPGRGTIYLTYSAQTGKNCVVTVRNNPDDQKVWMVAWLVRAGGDEFSNDDYGYFFRYAGPVYLYAPNTCVDWGGTIRDMPGARYRTNCG
jgi:hypothetical protein